MSSYLGQKGYTILKKHLTAQQLEFIYKELTVKPFTAGAPVGAGKSFPAYRESDNKIYLPRYFAEEHFGPPCTSKIPDGQDMGESVVFNGTLRDYQQPVVDKFIDYVKTSSPYGSGGLLELYCAWGKTSSSLFIAAALRKKTLVIVHKEFLMNQWVERIQQFLPNAKIGKIQGQIMDVEGKDIVLCMLQSLVLKDYPASLFETFGFTIIDEVHHISSETFSNALFKVVTKYMLGLSATMDRKDGTTKVFKMFLGKVVHKAVRDGDDDNVTVRCAKFYSNNDESYQEIVYDFRGNPQFSTMINKLCEYNRRSEFILQLVKDMLEENPKQQIMLLGHTRSLLTYFHDAIVHRKIADGSVGYYVGGMKEAALKVSEGKRIVLATYQMASEGLDIKTLSTIFFCTPKTSIEQSVGRILREKKVDCPPIVVDIWDEHGLFQKQWTKRKAFYKGQNYKIIETSNLSYHPQTSQWKVVFDPTAVNCAAKTTKRKKEHVVVGGNIDDDDDDEENTKEGNKKVGEDRCFVIRKKPGTA